jgi:sulfopyruvate decarboxylase subunit beta
MRSEPARLDAREAISSLLERYRDAFVVSTCGYTSRDLFDLRDSPRHFYMLGSMGMAAPLALGVALARPDVTVLVLDGDGAFAMNLGCTAMIAHEAPRGLVHVVLDNGTHESTGGQAVVPGPGGEEALRSLGYAEARVAVNSAALASLPAGRGPLLVRVPVRERTGKPAPRVTREPREIARTFAGALQDAR